MTTRVAVICGVLALPLSVATDELAGVLWRGYSFVWQSSSQLSAIGAPTRSVVVPSVIAGNVLLITFGLGVWRLARENRALRVTAALLVGNGALNLAAGFFPARLAVTPSAFSAGVLLGAAAVTVLLAAIGSGAVAYRNWFRYYSIVTLLAFAVLTVLGFVAQTSARVGLQERVMSYGYLLWVAVLAVVLLSAETRTGRSAYTRRAPPAGSTGAPR